MMIVKKAQGLMSDAEMEALLSNYFIYLVMQDTNRVLYEGEKEQLKLGAVGFNDLSAYTISPTDYNLLMEIGKQFKNKNDLYVIVGFENDFSITDFTVDIKIPPPTEVLRKHNINTRIGNTQSTRVHRKEFLTVNDFSHINPEVVEKHLDAVLTEVINNLKDMKLPIEPLTVYDYMNNPDIVKFPDNTYVYKLKYNADQLKDKYIKERNIVFPENFTNGFEKYFNEEGIKRVIRKIRKVINKAGGRERLPPQTNIRSGFYISTNAKEGAEEFGFKVENFALKYIESPEIKELDPTVFENMRNYTS